MDLQDMGYLLMWSAVGLLFVGFAYGKIFGELRLRDDPRYYLGVTICSMVMIVFGGVLAKAFPSII